MVRDRTHKKFLGAINVDMKPPIAEAGGKAWMTRNGTIAMFDDSFEREGTSAGLVIDRLPSGVVAETCYGDLITVP